MDLYTGSLVLGSAGLGLMALGGLGARGGHSHGPSHGVGGGTGGHGALGHTHAGHAVAGARGAGPAHAGAHSGAVHGGHAGHAGTHAASALTRGLSDRFASLLSPRLWFSLLVGFGATGLLTHRFLGGPVLLGVALAGGVLFEALIVGPFWRFLFRFASNPLVTLESAITDLATAVTSFDAQGQGLIAVDVDGQVVQCLATLRAEDKAAGRRVRSGDAVRIEDVDAARGRCTVSVPQN